MTVKDVVMCRGWALKGLISQSQSHNSCGMPQLSVLGCLCVLFALADENDLNDCASHPGSYLNEDDYKDDG